MIEFIIIPVTVLWFVYGGKLFYKIGVGEFCMNASAEAQAFFLAPLTCWIFTWFFPFKISVIILLFIILACAGAMGRFSANESKEDREKRIKRLRG